MKCKLTPQLSSDDWKDFCSRFHFSPADLPYIKAIYTALLPLVESCAYYSLDQNLDGISLPHYAYGFVTLGNGIDELSELYLDHEHIIKHQRIMNRSRKPISWTASVFCFCQKHTQNLHM